MMTSREMMEIKKSEREFVLEFLGAYKSLPCLWDMSSEEYVDRRKKMKAYDTLLDKFKERYPEATLADVRRKINSLRASFRKEMRRKEDFDRRKMREDDEEYESQVWLFEPMSFLCKNRKPAGGASAEGMVAHEDQQDTDEDSVSPVSSFMMSDLRFLHSLSLEFTWIF